ncbi:hypothetical protein ACS0TY_011096 [Phlomoides rotata]
MVFSDMCSQLLGPLSWSLFGFEISFYQNGKATTCGNQVHTMNSIFTVTVMHIYYYYHALL